MAFEEGYNFKRRECWVFKAFIIISSLLFIVIRPSIAVPVFFC